MLKIRKIEKEINRTQSVFRRCCCRKSSMSHRCLTCRCIHRLRIDLNIHLAWISNNQIRFIFDSTHSREIFSHGIGIELVDRPSSSSRLTCFAWFGFRIDGYLRFIHFRCVGFSTIHSIQQGMSIVLLLLLSRTMQEKEYRSDDAADDSDDQQSEKNEQRLGTFLPFRFTQYCGSILSSFDLLG